MAKIMAVNAGSSSIKFQLLEMPEEVLIASGQLEKIGTTINGENVPGIFTIKFNGQKFESDPIIPDHGVGVKLLLDALIEKGIVKDLKEIEGVGHRIVQGGEYFKDSCEATDEVVDRIYDLAKIAPLHNKAHVIGIKAFKKALPGVFEAVVFDTTFHQTMLPEAFMYATPYEWYTKYGIRKYGAHGTSHKYVSQKCAELMGKPLEDTKIIVCHLGNGASLSAVKGGKCIDTSMGLTPLEGIVMGTRSGNLDPTALEVVASNEGQDIHELIQILNKKSGYFGVSGISNDGRDLTNGLKEGNERCKLAFDMGAKRIVDYIGAYYVYLGGCDAICFTAGMGENLAHFRKNICDRLGVLGVKLDEKLNDTFSCERLISAPDSKIKVYIIPTNEEVMIARDVMRLKK